MDRSHQRKGNRDFSQMLRSREMAKYIFFQIFTTTEMPTTTYADEYENDYETTTEEKVGS